ncbi:hypothetical protein NEOLEDRAFT_1244149 [Neolentinus lepideus HHB14362 ss-1]|uniref:Uncharacterized protein n=1 Tax=Neolentinus lepideus HHB14362 ss-1 TaxID=1314782 RepID=A0A165Q6G4_9AGAM|nr:hypothetical protein NEOLEDRAFT_1244149 [Neolentinus lepideus HHB14362 ss-1]
MAEPILAVTVVADCSLAVSQDWDYIFKWYLFPIFDRLYGGTQAGAMQLRLGIVTYGTARTRPGPIVCKRFFSPLAEVLKEMKEKPRRFGTGTIASGGGKGTAALEGLVAATEMFDLLTAAIASSQERKPLQHQSLNHTPPKLQVITARHIIHIAALPPDGAKRPLRNNSPSLDNTTWDTLPEVLYKRGIKWSMILLQQSLTRFVDLHAKAEANDALPPWFQMRPTDTLRLVGLPQKISKRPGEPSTTPEPKRARITGPGSQASPNVSNASPPKVAPTPPSIAPKTNSSPAPAPATPTFRQQQPVVKTSPQQPPGQGQARAKHMTVDQVEEAMKRIEMELRAIGDRMPNLEREGPPERLQQARTFLNKKRLFYEQLKVAHTAMTKSKQNQGVSPGKGTGGGAEHVPVGNVPQQLQTGPSMPTHNTAGPSHGPSYNTNNHPFSSGLPMGAHLLQGMQGNDNVQQAANPAPAAMSEVDIQVQMQKLLDQRNNSRHQDVGSVPQPAANPSQSQAQPPQQGSRVRATWQGTIWVTGGTLETKFDVEVFSASVLDTRVWPSVMKVVPALMTTRDELQIYLKTIRATLCQVHPLKPPARAEVNVYRYDQVTNLLLTRNAYALATWTHPGDNQKCLNFLIVTLTGNEKKTFGAFWDSDGPPNVPRRLPATVPTPKMDPNQISMNARQQLLQIPPERRAAVIQQLIAKRSMMQSQIQHLQNQAGSSSQPMQQMGNPSVANPFTGNNMATFMNMDGGGVQGMAPNPGNAMQGLNPQGGFNFNPSTILAQSQPQNQQGMGGNPNMGMSQGMGPNMNMGMGMGQNFSLPGGIAPQHQRQPSGNGGFPQGGMGNVSLEMIQSFMQRNAEGGGEGS